MTESILTIVDGYIKKSDSTKYLALFHSDEKCERILEELDNLLC